MDPPSGDQERKSAAPPALDNPRALGEKKAPEKDQENPRDPSLELTDEDVSSSEDEPIRDEDLDILHSRFSVNSLSLRDLLKEQQKELEARKASGRRKKRGPTVPSSAFMYYRLDELDNVASNHPEATAEEVIKLVEDKWLRLDPEIRAIYQDKASKDRERYLEERRAYLPKSAGGLMKRHKKRKHPNAPKHPKSAYLFFTEDYRERVKKSNSGLTFHQIAKILGEKWANLGAEEKTVWLFSHLSSQLIGFLKISFVCFVDLRNEKYGRQGEICT